jgi:hypothetical protein
MTGVTGQSRNRNTTAGGKIRNLYVVLSEQNRTDVYKQLKAATERHNAAFWSHTEQLKAAHVWQFQILAGISHRKLLKQ